MRLTRRVYSGVNSTDRIIYDGVPCALCRSAYTHSPTPMDMDDITAVKEYRLRLYAAPEVTFMLGDRVEINHQGRIYAGIASDSFCYDSHSLCVVTIGEVREA